MLRVMGNPIWSNRNIARIQMRLNLNGLVSRSKLLFLSKNSNTAIFVLVDNVIKLADINVFAWQDKHLL